MSSFRTYGSVLKLGVYICAESSDASTAAVRDQVDSTKHIFLRDILNFNHVKGLDMHYVMQ